MFLAIDRVSRFAHVASCAAGKMDGAAFPREVVAMFSYAIHAVPTDDVAFADLLKHRDGPAARGMGPIFDRVRREHGTGHRLT
jgi:hypothetical protein